MKILFVIDTLQTGGAELSLLEITKRFKKYEPVFVQLFNGEDLKKQFEEAGIKVISLGLPVSYNIKEISKHILPVILEVEPVLIHSTLFHSDLSTRYLKKRKNFILINSFVNNSYSKRRYADMDLIMKMKLFIIQKWDRLTAKKVDLFFSNSHEIKTSNSRALGIPRDKIKVIFRGRNFQLFKKLPDYEIQEIKNNLGIGSEMVFLNVSRLLERKGQIDLIKAFNKVLEVYPSAILLLAGEGPFRKIIEKEISTRGLSKNVWLLGNRSDIPNLLQIADFFVFPSHFEGLPGALIEAMMSKTPIVASNIAENLECVDHNSAFLFKVQDIDDLAEKMVQIITDPRTISKTDRAYNFALENFDIRKIAEDYENSYDILLNP